jgi:hypothetical protein
MLNKFISKIEQLEEPRGTAIFSKSTLKNTIKYIDPTLKIIQNNINSTNNKKGIDLFCGHGNLTSKVNEELGIDMIAADIRYFDDWESFENVRFFQKNVFDIIQLDVDSKLDLIITMNSIRGNIRDWGEDNYNNFIKWCSNNTKFLITNNCTENPLQGFKLIDTIKTEGIFDVNIFKSTKDEKNNIRNTK